MALATPKSDFDCSYCGGNRTPETSVKGSFCSVECWWKHKGENIHRQIDNDHTRCSSCYARRKTVSVPPEEFVREKKVRNGIHSAESIIGFEYLEPHMKREHGFTYCKCGNIDHYAEIDELRNVDLQDVLVNLWSLLVKYYEQDQFGDNKPDKDVLFETLKESELDFRLALGKSVYGSKT